MSTPNDKTTMTIREQKRILRNHVIAFLEHQRKATEHLRAINAIGLLENDGNPLPCMIQGEAMLRHWSTITLSPAGSPIDGDGGAPFDNNGEFSDVIADIQQAIDINAHIV